MGGDAGGAAAEAGGGEQGGQAPLPAPGRELGLFPPHHGQHSAKVGATDVLEMGISGGSHLCPLLIFCVLSWEQVAGCNSKDACASFTELQPREDALLSSCPVRHLGRRSGHAVRCCDC